MNPLNDAYLKLAKQENGKHLRKWQQQEAEDAYGRMKLIPYGLGAILIAFIIFCLFFSSCNVQPARAETIDVEKLANAIYKAENSKTHPYGILAHYKHTTPRQACINTIKHALRDFKGGDFISFLGSRYCPVGAKNDPRGLNKFWISNVKRFYYGT